MTSFRSPRSGGGGGRKCCCAMVLDGENADHIVLVRDVALDGMTSEVAEEDRHTLCHTLLERQRWGRALACLTKSRVMQVNAV